MKRIFICLSIAVLSVAGLHAQQKDQLTPEQVHQQLVERQKQDLKVYQQEQAQQLQATIRSQTQSNVTEAAKRMETRKREVQNEVNARREQLEYRPAGMAPLHVK